MREHLLLGLASIIVLGISAQWLAWRFKLPSILLLLVLGLIAGPATGFIDPDAILGEMLYPIVSLSVAIILFEGGLSLKLSQLKATGSVVHRLITTGTLVSWFLGSVGAHYILGLEYPMAILLGAILVVTGPTVIIPLLRQVRPVGRVASILRWEGILIDPVGAVLAVLVYEAIVAGGSQDLAHVAINVLARTLLLGGVVGAAGAVVIVLCMRRFWIPDFLQNPVTLMTVIIVFIISNSFQSESGLLAVTIMGVVLANQKFVSTKSIVQFKEDLGVLIISILFILLAARLRGADLGELSFWSFLFLISLIVVARPASVLVSTIFSDLKWRERIFIALLAPRGIVAAAVSSVFAIRMIEAGYPQASKLVPETFLVIIGTVVVYGIGGSIIANRLKVAEPSPQGMLILGAHSWAVEIAKVIREAGFKVVLVDTNPANIFAARMAGLNTYYGSALSEAALQEIDMQGIGRLMALTPNNGVNTLAVLHFSEVFDSSELYQLAPQKEEKPRQEKVSKHLHGRFLFSPDVTYRYLASRFGTGSVIKKTKLTEEFGFEDFKERYGKRAVPLFLIAETGRIVVFTAQNPATPKPGHTVVALVDLKDEKQEVTAEANKPDDKVAMVEQDAKEDLDAKERDNEKGGEGEQDAGPEKA